MYTPFLRYRMCLRLVLLSLCSIFMYASMSVAQTGQSDPIAFSFLQSLKDKGLIVTFIGPITITDDILTIDGLEGHLKTDGRKHFKFGSLALSGASMETNNRLFISDFAAYKFEIDEPKFAFSADSILISDLYLSKPATQGDAISGLTSSLYSSAEILKLHFLDRSSGHSMPIERVTVTFDTANGGFPISAAIQVNAISLNQSVFGPPQQQMLNALGHTQLTADIAFEGEWNGVTGQLNVESASLVLRDLFTAQLSAKFKGLTETVLKQMAKLAAKDNVIALDQLQNTAVSSFSLSLINNGGLDELLKQQARKHNQSQDAYVRRLTEQAERQFGRIPDRAKSLEFTEAVYNFLQNPQNITVQATPKSPVSVIHILGVSAISPLSIVSLLGITLEANID
ncbi:hypothetical protein PsAD2_03836 [Pseudovibrio axinellae]|uniref:Uncharacterized protein n=1 Tax=Pseudovibrio axinellae TaxID=989403 RepID=A0A165ULX6_9HYPH|nr:hypothetical protein [Pseudovibrio axinellae]KZL12531.1 hypothetical protein PsAD2_03836 [Pseudovibrio axinellae]SEP68248.1 hypothetical protein SAMN05421798_101144 [Pseudovibrio axinellae]